MIPNPPINAGDKFSVSFEIKNQDDINDVKMGYSLYDYGLCKIDSKLSDTSTWDEANKISNPVTLSPLQTEFKEWQFSAPTNDQTGGLSSTCPIKFVVGYEFDSTSQVDVDVISASRLYDLQRAGQTPTFTPSLVVGRGPVKIYFSFGTDFPVRTNSTLPIFLTVEDKGQGLLRALSPGYLTLKIPKDLANGAPDCGTKMNCTAGNGKDSSFWVCKTPQIPDSVDKKSQEYQEFLQNSSTPMINKKSPQFRCSLTTTDSPSIIEKTFFINADLNYVYELTGQTSVGVKPILT